MRAGRSITMSAPVRTAIALARSSVAGGGPTVKKTLLPRSPRAWTAALSIAIPLSALLLPPHAVAATAVDQQQPVIDTTVGGLVIGGFYQQTVAQVVTAGISGELTEVRLPVACSPSASLSLQIQGVTNATPNGIVLGTTIVPGSSLPPFFPVPGVVTLRPLQLSQPVSVTRGQQFAIVLDAPGDSCGMFQGPLDDSYPGGNAYFDSRPNRVGVWVCICEFTHGRWDVPFQTLVEHQGDASPPVIVPTVSGIQGTNGWYTSTVTVTWNVSDPESGITSSSGCGTLRVTFDTRGMTLTCSATNTAGLSSSRSVTIKIDMTPPMVIYTGNLRTYTVDQTISITCSATDTLSGIAATTCHNTTGPAYSFALGTNTFSAVATDGAGNTATGTVSFTVRVTYDSLAALTTRFVSQAGVANALTAKLRAAQAAGARGDAAAKAGLLNAYKNQVGAQTGKTLTAQGAALLIRLVGSL